MATSRHTISLSMLNNKYATEKSELLFDGKLSKYLNYLLSKERVREYNKLKKT